MGCELQIVSDGREAIRIGVVLRRVDSKPKKVEPHIKSFLISHLTSPDHV